MERHGHHGQPAAAGILRPSLNPWTPAETRQGAPFAPDGEFQTVVGVPLTR